MIRTASTLHLLARSSSRGSPNYLARCFSVDSKSQDEKKVVVYEGQHGKRIFMLRRVSFASTLLTIPLVAATALIETDVIPVAAQLALVGTVGFATISSTTMLHFVTSPYVLRLSEILKPSSSPSSSEKRDREFVAVTCGIYGQQQENRFLLSQTERPSPHPFGSFRVKNGRHFYVFGGALKDSELQAALTKEGVTTSEVEKKE